MMRKRKKPEVIESFGDRYDKVWPEIIEPRTRHKLIRISARMKPQKRMALLMVIAQYEVKQISEVIHRSRQTIYNWLKEIKEST